MPEFANVDALKGHAGRGGWPAGAIDQVAAVIHPAIVGMAAAAEAATAA